MFVDYASHIKTNNCLFNEIMTNNDRLLVLILIVNRLAGGVLCIYSKGWCLKMDTLHLEMKFPSTDLTAPSSTKCGAFIGSCGWIARLCKKHSCCGMHITDLHSCEFHLGDKVLAPKLYDHFKFLSSRKFSHTFPHVRPVSPKVQQSALSWP